MNTMRAALSAVILLSFLLLPGSAAAEDLTRMMVRVPHDFTVGDQALPTGRYSVSTEDGTPAVLHLHDVSGSACARLPVITRLAECIHEDNSPRLVFDRVGGQYFLSEVWLGKEDGYLVRGTPKEHTHEIIHFGN